MTNGNNRVTPEANVNLNFQPASAPVDKTISYQPDLTEAKKTAATADALAKLGQGALDYAPYLRRKAMDSVISASFEEESKGGNKKEWANVSKHIEGLAKFNPYLKDSYKTLTAQDIYRSGYVKLISNPNIEKMDSAGFNKLLTTTKAQMQTAFKESGLDPKNYVNYAEKFETDCYNITQAYTAKNAEYTYNNSLTKHGSDLGFQLGVNVYNTKDPSLKSQTITASLDTKIRELTDLGTPKDDIAKVVTSGIQSYIVNNADTLNSVALETAAKNIKINGQSIDEIVPNYAFTVHEMVRTAKRAKYEERQVDYQDQQLTLKINTNTATSDFFQWYKKNQNASGTQVVSTALGLIDKYDLKENSFGFLNEVVKDRGIWTDLKTVISDPNVEQELGALSVTGKLTGERIEREILNGKLNINDGLKFYDRIDKEAKAEVKALETDLRQFDSQLKDTGLYGSQLKNDSSLIDMRNKVNQLKIDLDAGRITKEQAQQKASYYAQHMNEYVKMKKTTKKNKALLMNGAYLRSLPTPVYEGTEKATQVFKEFGYVRGAGGQRKAFPITSGISVNRTINGKSAPHKTYDIGAPEGSVIWNVDKKAVVIFAGTLPDLGNYAILEYENGTYCRIGHMQHSVRNSLGKTILPQQKIGYVGNTGRSTGPHADIGFFNSSLQYINATTFKERL